MPKYVLTGADGPLGRAAADFALELAQPGDEFVFTTYQRARVPADVVATWEARRVRVVDLAYDDDAAALTAVFAGAAAVAFASPWTVTSAQRRAQAANVIAACQATTTGTQQPPPRLVYASLVGAGRPEAQEEDEEKKEEGKEEDDKSMPALVRDHAAVERALAASGLPHTVHRDFLYSDTVAEVFAPTWRYCGDAWLDNTLHVRGGYVSRADCGRVHAALMCGRGDERHRDGRRAYDVTGPELVTAGQMLDWACAQTGYQGEVVAVSDAELRRWWATRGLPVETPDAVAIAERDPSSPASPLPPVRLGVDDLVACGQLVARGYMQEITDTVEKLTGRVPRCFRQTLIHYKDDLPRAEDTSDCDHVGASREEEEQ